jgi:hypothetical protein
MIISASYKTDIPTFYGEWFRNRLRAGFCKMVNPYNRKQVYEVSLRSKDVDGFVFWTKNAGPFLGVLDEVAGTGRPFVVQYTINGYPRELESRVVDSVKSVEHFKRIVEKFGARVPVWRYDTIVFSSLTPPRFHLDNFARLAAMLEGATDEVVVSFMQVYGKTKRNLDLSADENGFRWRDPSDEEKLLLLRDMVSIARSRGMTLTMCAQPQYAGPDVPEASCIDTRRLGEIAGSPITAQAKGSRKECRCAASKDIGDYDTCPHGYCYAVRNRDLALDRHRQHDPEGEFLFPVVDREPSASSKKRQLPLF